LVFNDKNEFQYVYRGPKSLAAFLLLFNRLVPFGLETPRRDCLRADIQAVAIQNRPVRAGRCRWGLLPPYYRQDLERR
jgi:hypothetical protein